MDKNKLNQYMVCSQAMVEATSADQILLNLKLYLNSCLEGLSMLYFSNTEGEESNLRLLAYLDSSDALLVSYDSRSIDLESEAVVNKISSLHDEMDKYFTVITKSLKNENFNADAALQETVSRLLPGVVTGAVNNVNIGDLQLSCFPACVPVIDSDSQNALVVAAMPRKIWCLLLFDKNKKNKQYLSENSDMVLVLINLVFSHIGRLEALQKLKQENNWVQSELQQIAALQRQLLPQDDITIKGVDIAANFRPCEHAGGDYYDFLSMTEILEPMSVPRSSDYWGSMIADSAGHGATAAVEISMFDAILRTMKHEDSTVLEGPAGVFNYANQYLFTRIIRGTFITSFVAGYNPDLEKITYSCAGHPPPILYRSSSQDLVELDQSAGIPLGVVKDFVWENASVAFNQNDILLMYTDGILEATNRGGEQFGLERLKAVMTEDLSLSCKEIITKIEVAVEVFQQGSARKDDQTLVIIKRL